MLTVIQENNHAHGNGHFTRNKTVLKSHHCQAPPGRLSKVAPMMLAPCFPGKWPPQLEGYPLDLQWN